MKNINKVMTIQWCMDPVTTSQPTGNKWNPERTAQASKRRFSEGKTKII